LLSHAEDTPTIYLESTFIGDNEQTTTTHIKSWESSPSPDYLRWEPDHKLHDDTLDVIDRDVLQRTTEIYDGLNMEKADSRYSKTD
jgi:hypothetical protein